jgi:hypothetical protein
MRVLVIGDRIAIISNIGYPPSWKWQEEKRAWQDRRKDEIAWNAGGLVAEMGREGAAIG